MFSWKLRALRPAAQGESRWQPVAPEEAVLIASAQAHRLALVQRASPTLFGLRSDLIVMDDILSDRADTDAVVPPRRLA
jgi:hypothetical protein